MLDTRFGGGMLKGVSTWISPVAKNFRSLVPGGYFSSHPFDRNVPASVRTNNAGAINGAKWELAYPGYVGTVETTPGNFTTIFEAPEYGIAAWWELLHRYSKVHATTLSQIITKYGGGQDYSNYLEYVTKKSGLAEDAKISIDDDTVLLLFGKAMFSYESGMTSAGKTIPWSDKQIVFGIELGRVGGDLSKMSQSSLADEPSVSLFAAAKSDKDCLPLLIKLGSDVESLHVIQDTAAKSMKAAGYGYTMHNACAATLSAFLNSAGIQIKTTLGAGRLAQRLSDERGWQNVNVGAQAPGDVGVAKNNVHVFLVVKVEDADRMIIADNQKPTPHTRSASGVDGRTATAYFLRAPDEHPVHLANVPLVPYATSDDFYPDEDEETNNLMDGQG